MTLARRPLRRLALACASLVLAAGAQAGGGSSGNGDGDVPGEVLVKLQSSDALAPLLTKYGLTLVDRFGSRPIFRLKTIGNQKAKDVVAKLALEPGVMIAETNRQQDTPEGRSNQPWTIGTPQQFATQWAPQAMRLAEAHKRATGAGVRVAVLDTGVDRLHPALAGRLLPGFDFVDFDNDPSETGLPTQRGWGHGTHVAGLVAMVAPGAAILPVRVLDANGAGNAWVLAEGLLYALDPDGDPSTDDGAQVVNLSLGSLSRTRLIGAIARLAACEPSIAGDAEADHSDPGYRDDDLRCATSRGTVVVAAAGNDGSSGVKEYPAAEGEHNLLAVGASNAAGRLASFSNNGSWVGLAAPGDLVTSAVPGGWGTWSGTSMAAPLAAGTAALLWSAEPRLSADDVARRVTRTGAVLCGSSLRQVDALAALTNTAAPGRSCR